MTHAEILAAAGLTKTDLAGGTLAVHSPIDGAELARVRKLGEAMAEDAAVRISQADMERATKAVKSAGI